MHHDPIQAVADGSTWVLFRALHVRQCNLDIQLWGIDPQKEVAVSNGRGKHKSRNRKRTKKISKGLRRGAARIHLDEVTKVLLGKGITERFEPEQMNDYRKWFSRRQNAILAEPEATVVPLPTPHRKNEEEAA